MKIKEEDREKETITKRMEERGRGGGGVEIVVGRVSDEACVIVVCVCVRARAHPPAYLRKSKEYFKKK